MNLVEWDEVEELNKKAVLPVPLSNPLFLAGISGCINIPDGGTKPPYGNVTDRHKNAHRGIWQVSYLLRIFKEFDGTNILQYLYAKLILRTNF